MPGHIQVSMFCGACKSLAYGAKCFICGGATEPLDSTVPRDLVARQTQRLERVRQIDGWCVTAMILALTTIGLATAGMRLGRRSLVPTMIMLVGLAAAQLLGAKFKANWKRIAIVLALGVACGLLVWLPGFVTLLIIAPQIVVLLWFFVRQSRASEPSSGGTPGAELRPAMPEQSDFGAWREKVPRRGPKLQSLSSWSPDDIASAVRVGVVIVTAVVTTATILSCKLHR